jgi:hypothetical protein
MPQLSPPRIVTPLVACSPSVRLQGQVTGARVTIRVQSPSWGGGTFTFTAAGADEAFTLPRDLAGGDRVSASQDKAGYGSSIGIAPVIETVPPPPDLSELAAPTALNHLFACGSCIAVGNVFPGAEVTISSATRGQVGKGVAEATGGLARLALTSPFEEAEQLSALQSLCGLTGPTGGLPAPDRPPAVGRKLDPPAITPPLIDCDSAVPISGIFEGAAVSLRHEGGTFDACCDFPSTRLLIPPLRQGQHVDVRQRFPSCEYESDWSPRPGVTVGPATALPAPWIGALCREDGFVVVHGLREGAEVVILNGSQDIGGGEAWAETCVFAVAALMHNDPNDFDVQSISAFQARCGQRSPTGPATDIGPLYDVVPTPALPGPLVEFATVVRVENCFAGTQLDLFMKSASGVRQLCDHQYPSGTTMEIAIAPGLVAGSEVWATQAGCSGSATSVRTGVTALGDPRAPTVVPCGSRLMVTGGTAGCRTEIYRNGGYLWGGSSGAPDFLVDPPTPLQQGDTVSGRTIAAGRISPFGPTSTVDRDRDNSSLGFMRTEWVAQEIGDSSPNHKPTTSHTSDVDVIGTDLGVAIDHVFNGEPRTYFFFGDTDSGDELPKDADSIAWTTDAAPNVRGFRLNFVTEGGHFRPLAITGNVSLGGFEVPSGGFSHDGKIYLFATTDHFKEPNPAGGPDWDVMGASVLASAADPHNDFDKLYPISTRNDRASGGFKFINISAQVVSNDSVPGLPDVATPGGTGLVLVGSGVYRRSSPFLAYAPLAAGGDPARADWRFLSGLTAGVPGFGPKGKPSWSAAEADAIPIFDDPIVGELSVVWHEELERWLLLYEGTLLRSARWPWGPWSAAIRTFDGATGKAEGWINPPGATYGPYVVRRFGTWDALHREATIYHMLSTWDPYAASLMRTVVRLDCA